MDQLLGDHRLHTVCREAVCPNITECFRSGQATFLILGKNCTRLCSFCNVTKEPPLPIDPEEPGRVARAIVRLGLSHVVITSPTRDDLVDGGAGLYAATVAVVRGLPETRIELLIPDFLGAGRASPLLSPPGRHHRPQRGDRPRRLYAVRPVRAAGAAWRCSQPSEVGSGTACKIGVHARPRGAP